MVKISKVCTNEFINMDKIKNNYGQIKIRLERIKPFKNICRVTNQEEFCNVEIEYIPNEYLIEIGSYRSFFEKEFNMFIEEICYNVFDEIYNLLSPKHLSVTIYLEGNDSLTNWSVNKAITKK